LKTKAYGPFNEIITLANLPPAGPVADSSIEIIKDAWILVENGRIKTIEHKKPIGNVQLIEIEGPAVAIPGLIDSHTHLCWGGVRCGDYQRRLNGESYQEIASSGGGILSTVKATRAATFDSLLETTIDHLDHQMQQGITTCEIKSGYGLDRASEIKMLQVINTAGNTHLISVVSTCLAAHTMPPEFTSRRAYLQLILNEILPEVKAKYLSERVDIFIEKGAFSADEAASFLIQAKKLGFTITVHADQFSTGGSSLASQVGAISADHLEASGDQEINLLKKHNVIPVVLPGASLGLGLPFAAARKMLDAGLPLVIASDWNPGSAPMGMLLCQAAIMGAKEKLSMAETLLAMCSRAAKVLALDDRGELKPGMRADIAIFPSKDYRDILYYQGAMKAKAVIINGEMPCSSVCASFKKVH